MAPTSFILFVWTMRAVWALALVAVSTPNVSGFQQPSPIITTNRVVVTKLTAAQQPIMATDDRNNNKLSSISNADHILFDVPVSNNGARCRIILYKKGISQNKVDIVSPAVMGGLKSEEYMKISPNGLMPCLAIQKKTDHGMSSLVESDTIARYLLSEYTNDGPTFLPDHPRSNQICRWHDMYLTPIQGCMYKAVYTDRKSTLLDYRRHINIIEGFISNDDEDCGPYLCGTEVSLADATLFPSAVFASYMLPKFDDMDQPPLPPKLTKWFNGLRTNDETFTKVYNEIMDTLVHTWEEGNHRWDSIWLAGIRDTSPSTIFDKILSGVIPADIVRQDEYTLAFRDINPQAPAHVLIIPKDRNGLTSLRKATTEHTTILGRLLLVASDIVNDTSLGFGDGARIVINDGADGGQEVYHLHVHVLGGRKMGPSFG
jgi:diadenosine tetraphosphate (Ap4A) HIT family hydrolase/glutathione S-transferase